MIKMHSTNRLGTYFLLLVLAVIAAAGLYFRLWQLPLQLLADDEWHALNKLLRSDAWGIYTSFGHADHSIPVTLYYYFISQITPLTENIMRGPMLLAGLATPVAAVWLVRRCLSRPEQAILFALLALSPILIYFTRTARPYALSTVLAFAAVVVFYYWTREPRLRYAVAYVMMCSLSAWMQPVTLTLMLSPFLFFGGKSLYLWIKRGDRSLFWRLLVLGLTQLAALCALLGPPVYFNLKDITGKTGVDSPTLHSVLETFKLLAGSEYGLYTGAFLLFAAWGAFLLGRRKREFTLLLLFCSLLSLTAILCSGAAWIQHSLVTARYGLPVLLIMAVFAAVGLNHLLQFASRFKLHPGIGLALLCIAVFAAGPLTRTYQGAINQFTGHMAYQFDYDWDQNVYNTELDKRPRFHLFFSSWGNNLPSLCTWYWLPGLWSGTGTAGIWIRRYINSGLARALSMACVGVHSMASTTKATLR